MARVWHRPGRIASACYDVLFRSANGAGADARIAAFDDTRTWDYFAFPSVTLAELFIGMKPELPPLVGPVKTASRVQLRTSRKPGAQGALL